MKQGSNIIFHDCENAITADFFLFLHLFHLSLTIFFRFRFLFGSLLSFRNAKGNTVCVLIFWNDMPRTGSIFVRSHLCELEWDDIQGSISFEMDLKQNSVNSLKSFCIWQRKPASIECQCRKGTEFYEDICKVDFPVEDENARCGDRFLLWPTFWRNGTLTRALLHFQNSIRPINFPSISISYELGVCLFVTI